MAEFRHRATLDETVLYPTSLLKAVWVAENPPCLLIWKNKSQGMHLNSLNLLIDGKTGTV